MNKSVTMNRQTRKRMMQQLMDQIRSKTGDAREPSRVPARKKAARQLLEFVLEELRASPDLFTAVLTDLNQIINVQVNSQDPNELYAGILAIDVMLEVELNATQLAIFGSYLRLALINSDQSTVPMVAAVLGKLVKVGAILMADVVEREAKKALDWLKSSDTKDAKKYAAVVVLKELALSAPTIFFSLVDAFTTWIWSAVRDPATAIREGAAEAVRAVLQIMSQRESRHNTIWYDHYYEKSLEGLESKCIETIHGSLLVIAEVFQAQPPLINTKFETLCQKVLKLQDHPNRYVKRSVIEIIPQMATYRVDIFCFKFGGHAISYMINVIKKHDPEKATAFASLAKIIPEVGEQFFVPFQEETLRLIESTLSFAVNKPHVPEAVECLASMCQTNRSAAVEKVVTRLVDDIFSWPIHITLPTALTTISEAFPNFVPCFQIKLLNCISQSLCGTSYGSASATFASTYDRRSTPNVASSGLEYVRDTSQHAKILLALRMLRMYDFSPNSLCEFVRDSIMTFIDDESPVIRHEAVCTCSKLAIDGDLEQNQTVFLESRYRHEDMESFPLVHYNTDNALLERCDPMVRPTDMVVSEILDRLLAAALSDPEPDIRMAIMASLDNRFDHILCSKEKLQFLVIALNDENIRVRETVISVLGRLSPFNSSETVPVLRQRLMQILMELKNATCSQEKEKSCRILGILIQAAPRVAELYLSNIVKVVQRLLNDSSPQVVVATMTTLGQLATTAGLAMAEYLDDFLPTVIDTLGDRSSSSKRGAALRCLAQLCQSTGYVMNPYVRHPQLFPNLKACFRIEDSPERKRELIRVVGIIGAFDPFKMGLLQEKNEEDSNPASVVGPRDINANDNIRGAQYYTTTVLNALIRIMRDSTLSPFHKAAMQALMSICSLLGSKCAPFLDIIIPNLINFLAQADTIPRQKDILMHFAAIIQITTSRVGPYLHQLMEAITPFWKVPEHLVSLLNIIMQLATHLGRESGAYLPRLLPSLLQLIKCDMTESCTVARRVLYSIATFQEHLCSHLNLLVPILVKLTSTEGATPKLRISSLKTLRSILLLDGIQAFAASIVHTMTQLLATQMHMRRDIMLLLCDLIYQLGSDYTHYIPLVHKVLTVNRISHPYYEWLLSLLLRGLDIPAPSREGTDAMTLPCLKAFLLENEDGEDLIEESLEENYSPPPSSTLSPTKTSVDEGADKKLVVNQMMIKRVVEECKQKTTKEDWDEWLKKFAVELLQQSAYLPLRYCSALANQYQPLARELFNVAFVANWNEMSDKTKDDVERSLELGLMNNSITPEVMQTLLNLVEFMEINDMPMHIANLAPLAEKSQAYAKALRWKEMEFQNSPHSCIDELISINTQLQRPESALGLLTYATKEFGVKERESWYEKLGRWEEALKVFNEEVEHHSDDPERMERITLGKMRCLAALAEWDQLYDECRRTWRSESRSDDEEEATIQQAVAPLAVEAAWNLGEWKFMAECVEKLPPTSLETSFYKAILCVHDNEFREAQVHIKNAREFLFAELAALISESYSRAYEYFVQCQKLAELEEIMEYKVGSAKKQQMLRGMWLARFKGLAANVDHWRDVLAVRSLVLDPKDDLDVWLKFVGQCQTSGHHSLERKTLLQLLGEDVGDLAFDIAKLVEEPGKYNGQVSFAYLQHCWATGQKRQSCMYLEKLVNMWELDGPSGDSVSSLLARCVLQLGEWETALLNEGSTPLSSGKTKEQVLQRYQRVLELDPKWYRAWHVWALANVDVVRTRKEAGSSSRELVKHIVAAVNGFISSIKYGRNKSTVLQDVLRLLTLWFEYGNMPEVEKELDKGLESVDIATWLMVVPQIIARMHAKSPAIMRLITKTMTKIGKERPQALIPPITVCTNSSSADRRAAANQILNTMKQVYPNLVEQAGLMSQELIRCAIIWPEMWHDGLEEASKVYFGQKDIQGMLKILIPLHTMMQKTETVAEVAFTQSYGHDLQEAYEWCRSYQKTGDEQDINQAWELYYNIFKKINVSLFQQQGMSTLELQYVSPKLFEAKDMELAMPGLRTNHNAPVTIASFHPTLTVMSSKQRPRRLNINGSNGQQYQFLLKGHEDLRLDERVMQLFGLVNALLHSDTTTANMNLTITRYAVIPLSSNAGIIGWVENCDTFHQLVKSFREKKKVAINVEHRHITSMTTHNDAEHLPLIRKVELFEYAMQNTTGQDIYKVLWLQSPNSEVWLNRRTLYARSLAAMSMVGYILGLGDRHPNNLMLQRVTGKVVHIDFGDCFEVAMHREKFPERIPFRLTRMLINAMEVSGIEGNYRYTCENVMRVLRENKDSVMALLEAFAHDPLISWRLVVKDKKAQEAEEPSKEEEKVHNPIGAIVEQQQTLPGEASSRHPERVAEKPMDRESEEVNHKAKSVIDRIADKLTGTDFRNTDPTLQNCVSDKPLAVADQVSKLIQQATNVENLCQCYIGWCPFW